MTRNEAVKILSRIWGTPQYDLSNNYVDAFVSLGMLKLDEPKSAREKFIESIEGRIIGHSGGNYSQQYVVGPSDASILLQCVEASGLKIVEK